MTQEWLYQIRPTRLEMLTEGPTSEEGEIMSAHFRHLKQLTDAGVVILAGPTLVTDERNFGVVIFRADDEAAAQQLMASDPAVAGGVMSALLFPFRVSLKG